MGESFYETALDAAQNQEIEEVEIEEEELTPETISILEIGHLKGVVNVGDNKVAFRTLTIGEELEASLLAQPYKDTADESRALMTAQLSKAVVSVNDAPLLGPTLGPFQETAELRFQHMLKWHWPVILNIYTEFATITDQVYSEYNEVKKD